MKEWATAAASYREYLDLDAGVAERDRVGLKLAQCYWELADYYPAAEILQDVSQTTESADLAFQSRLLRARVHVHMADYEIVNLLLKELNDEAEVHKSEGEVALVEAEALMAQGQAEKAAPLLENIPPEWQNPAVKARVAEILGNIYRGRGEWEKAREKFQAALVKKSVLDDVDHVRQLAENLGDFLAAEQSLVDASGPRVARLKLLQANSLLFGFERPLMAASLYVEAAVDTAADPTVAARAYYGGYLVYSQHLDQPDSAAICRNLLVEQYPESPQAYVAGTQTAADVDLYGYLVARREVEQEQNYAALTVEELAALADISDVETSGEASDRHGLAGVRRRMVYLSRRDNIVYPPPLEAVQNIAERRRELVRPQALEAAQQAAFDSTLTVEKTEPTGNSPQVDEFGHSDTATPVTDASAPESADKADLPAETEPPKKPEKDKNWDFLR